MDKGKELGMMKKERMVEKQMMFLSSTFLRKKSLEEENSCNDTDLHYVFGIYLHVINK